MGADQRAQALEARAARLELGQIDARKPLHEDPGAAQDQAIAEAVRNPLDAAREETETCRRSRASQPAPRRRPDTRPLTIGALFPGEDFELPQYLEGGD